MATHVVRAGHETTVWNRSPGKADDLVSLGAREASSVSDAVADAEVVVMMLADPAASEAVLHAVADAATRQALVIDATTVGPQSAARLGATAEARGLRFVDAPVAGSLAPAESGSLGSFIGGSDADVGAARPVVELWCDESRVFHLGATGTGNALKLVVNMTIGILAAGTGEALRLAGDLGVDRERALAALSAGPVGWVMAQKGEQIAADNHTDVAFSLDLLTKDLALAAEAATRDLPLTAAVLDLARRASSDGGRGPLDYAALVNAIEGSRSDGSTAK